MQIIEGVPDEPVGKNPVVTIGNFDGVHIGHQKIFRLAAEKAGEIGGTPVAITFNPHPVRVLAPERGMKLITTLEHKRELIAKNGIRTLICLPFDKDFAKTEPDDFIKEVLVETLGARWVIVGHSYSFGKGKKGTTTLLRASGRKYGFGVKVVRYARVYDDIVSSSRIRSLVLRGRVCEAARMLGRAYHMDGTIIKGAGRGASLLKIPTANLSTDNELIPKEGVYAVRVSLKDTVYDGVANIGKNPTFGDVPVSYETHLFDLKADLLGQNIRLHFIDRIRDEKKFPGVQELIEHINKDISKARQILSKRKDLLFL
ncbi:MAG: bifunctional riboflavin kinase/FAD synthetase [Nitrospirae bacterium]|nr:MAG: bifunctional riboflavin kinase/FAD synthetase [Nitrospirota bacterium]